jgi:hypothetical protein
VKQAREESVVNNRFSEMALADQQHEACVITLESVAAKFDKSFPAWTPEVDSSPTLVKLEVSKLNSFFDSDAKVTSTPKSGVLPIESTATCSSAGPHVDGPYGHSV